GSVLGTFAIYRGEPGEADEREFQTVGMLKRIAALAIERDAIESQRAELQQRERDALGAAETANQIKDEFLATVSHELRTPLMAIVGWATLLREMPHDEETREGLAIIESSARAQAQIIDDLLDFSRITADKLRIDIRPVGLETMIREAVETVRPAAESAGVTLEVELEPLPKQILGDPDRVRQMIWNLLTNAIKFAAGGKVTLATSDEEGFATVAVSDTGEGIDPAFIPHVFDRFSQADPSRRRSHGGLGLGLSIVRRLVEMHHGSVEARSEGKGKGSTFVIRLPYAMDAVAGDETLTRHDAIDRGLSGARILLVEDDPPAREVLRRMLANAGATVSAASSAAEAIEIYRRDRPDVMVSDIAMPEMDGLQLARAIRADHPLPRVPMIALTSYAREADRDEALAAGFDYHIAKPVDYETLILAVRTALASEAPAPGE
ncbi:MAG: response regulator, partial [Acidobacteria bacterium]|nr:response regulator [Acidobacteriota bacterium]